MLLLIQNTITLKIHKFQVEMLDKEKYFQIDDLDFSECEDGEYQCYLFDADNIILPENLISLSLVEFRILDEEGSSYVVRPYAVDIMRIGDFKYSSKSYTSNTSNNDFKTYKK